MMGQKVDEYSRPIHLIMEDRNWLGRMDYVNRTLTGRRYKKEAVGPGWLVGTYVAGIGVGVLLTLVALSL